MDKTYMILEREKKALREMKNMANIEIIRSKLKAWQARDGSNRYYVNDWKDMIGLHVEYHKSGNVSDVWFDRREEDELDSCSNHAYNKYIRQTKVWFDDAAQLHIDYLDEDFTAVRDRILKSVDAAFTAPVQAPRTPRQLIQVSLCAFL